MSGITKCPTHGMSISTLVSTRLKELIKDNKFIQHIEEVNLLIEGIKVSFYSDMETAQELGWKREMKFLLRPETLEEFDKKNIISVKCNKCVDDYINEVKNIHNSADPH